MKRKRKNFEKIIAIQNLLERREKFNCDYGRIVGKWSMPDERYKYRQNWFHKTLSVLLNSLLAVVAPVYLKLKYGAKVIGKENLKELNGRGAICICNHIDWLDTLFVRQATGYLRSYHTVAPYNNKKGIGGAVMRHGNVLPFSANLKAMKNMSDEMQRLLENGKIINFYPEQALWNAYREPRPMKLGAFHYAVKYNVPIVPIFCTFERTDKCKIKKLKIHILKPINADDTLSVKARISDFKTKAEIAWENKEINFEIDVCDVTVHHDATLLELVWNNLLSNAVKFTEKGGTISLTSEERDGFVYVAVKDSGCGMSEQTVKRIYDKFYQGDTSHSTEGNGLGMAMVKKVLELENGEINVNSKVGEGTEFTVKLPL